MEHQDIRYLAQIMRETGLTVLELREGDFSVRMERMGAGPAAATPPISPECTDEQAATPKAAEPDAYTVAAPMIGVFYASPSPDMKPFVSIGDTVRAGDVLCIIEAMKMMNEITAETGGVVTEICVGNKQVVDFGHPLFRLRPAQPAAEAPEG